MHNRRITLPARALAAGGAALGIVALSGGAASAHVTVTPSTTEAGASAILTFSNGHGCEGSPTTKLTRLVVMGVAFPLASRSWMISWRFSEGMDASVRVERSSSEEASTSESLNSSSSTTSSAPSARATSKRAAA